MWYEIFKFEIIYRLKRLETYLYFIALFLFSMIAFDFIFESQSIGQLDENAPYIIARLMAIISGIFMLIVSLVMGVPILRDFEHKIESLVFVNPINKRDYLWGHFLGSFVVLVFIFSAVIWGLIAGEFLPWRDETNQQAFTLWAYINPFLTIVIPSLFFTGSLFFVSGALSKNLIVVYTQGVLFFVFFIISSKVDNALLASILEPFGYTALGQLTESWSIEERNSRIIPLAGKLLYNRLFWLAIGGMALSICYSVFDFSIMKDKSLKKKQSKNQEAVSSNTSVAIPRVHSSDDFKANLLKLKYNSIFYFKSIIKEVSFWSIVICGIVIIAVNSVSLAASFGVDSLPKTYLIVEELQESSIFFFLIILVFYSGELIWKERAAKIDQIYDSLPQSDFVNLAGKFIGLLLIYGLLLIVLIFAGIIFQTIHGFYQYDLYVYLVGFFLEVFPFLVLYTFISFFVHTIVNSKYISYLLVMVFFIATMALDVLDYGHQLFRFGGTSIGKYSEMNGYGHFFHSYFSFQFYWLAFAIVLFFVSTAFVVRGTDEKFSIRLKAAKSRFGSSLLKASFVFLALFLSIGTYIFYNTDILNNNWTRKEKLQFRADYENTIKKFEDLVQPKLVEVKLDVELYPSERNYDVKGSYTLVNSSSKPLKSINVQKWIDQQIELTDISFGGGAITDSTYSIYGFNIYHLNEAIQPGDSIEMKFTQHFKTSGFVADNSSVRIVHNGIFFDNQSLPKLGYNPKFEIDDVGDRKQLGLLAQKGLSKRNDIHNKTGSTTNDYEINLEVTIGTAIDQIAIAPGKLLAEYEHNGRQYFHYKTDHAMMNLYSINSADYQIVKDNWVPSNGEERDTVDLAIYHHEGHELNLDRMMIGMKLSLEYYSKHFSEYQYEQLSIIEFPRYIEFAQSFPNMIPFSEAIGFILDIDDVKDVDIAFLVTAHEVAHQWWGHQVTTDDTQGSLFVIESLAHYSALMVLKENFPPEKVHQFLRGEMDTYLMERMYDSKTELPLELVEKQDYIYYQKGAVNLFALQDYIGEEKMNLAISQFINDWNVTDGICKQERYPHSGDLLDCFRVVTPDSLQYVITDLFESITLYKNSIQETSFDENENDMYDVSLDVQTLKYKVDSLGIENSVEADDWIDVGIFAEDENGDDELIYLQKHRFTTSDTSLKIVLDRLPTKVGIDPLNKLIDKKIEDNVIRITGK